MTRWNWVEPSFFAFLCSLLCFCGREEEGQVLVLVVVVVVVEKTTTTKGVIVYMYCIVCTIIHIHLLFLVWSDAPMEVNSLLFCFLFHFVLVRRARGGILLRYGRFRVGIKRKSEKVSSYARAERTKQDRQTRNASPERVLRGRVSNWG